MKKLFLALLFVLLTALLLLCLYSSHKLNLRIQSLEMEIEALENQSSEVVVPEIVEADEEEEVEAEEEEHYINIVSPADGHTIYEEPIEFNGMVSLNAEKIVVTTSGVANDVYTLEGFKYGDGNFTYKAQSSFNNLAYGTNEYEFRAFFDDGSTEAQSLTIFYLEN